MKTGQSSLTVRALLIAVICILSHSLIAQEPVTTRYDPPQRVPTKQKASRTFAKKRPTPGIKQLSRKPPKHKTGRTFAKKEVEPEYNPVHKYEWAYRLKEAIQPAPTVALPPSETSSIAPPTNQVKHSAWPRGRPKTLIETIERRKVEEEKYIAELAAETKAIDPQSSRLERLYGGNFELEADRDLTQFGYQIFSQGNDAQFPTGPTPASYLLDSGDEILVTLSGAVDAFHKLTIDRDGVVSIPEFGTLPLAGTYYGDLHATLLAFLQQYRHNFELQVSLGGRRSIQVNIIGRAKQPGRVEIPALSNPIIALSAAGGVQKDGSLRSIILSRTTPEGTIESVVDLYDFLRPSEQTESYLQLREGDTLYIPAIGATVGIAGYVQEPGIYEINSAAFSIADALELSGGLTPFSFTPLARIERTVDGRGRKRSDIELSAAGMQQTMKSGELLMIEAIDDQRQSIVSIEGEVARPGDFEYTEGMTLSELINRADGLTVDAYLKQAFISRQIGQSTEIETIPGRSSHPQSRRVLVAQLDKALMRDAAHDFVLMPLDLVTVRSRDAAVVQPTVEIIGSVQRPGTYEVTASMRVSDLIAIAGNLTPDVYYDEAELIRRHFDSDERLLDVKRYRLDLQQALAPQNHNSDTINPVLSNSDRLVIRSLQKAQVRARISGRVRFPGEYIFPDGAQITDLISAAGGLLDDADLRAAFFTRESTKRLQQAQLRHLIERTRALSDAGYRNVAQHAGERELLAADFAREYTERIIKRAEGQARGRIVVPFNTPDFPSTSYNLHLQPGDTLTIPRRHSTISVAGDVFRPTTFVVNERILVNDALKKAGGTTEMADPDLVYIIRADGEIDRGKALRFAKFDKNYLYPGDMLLVPTAPIKPTLLARFYNYAQLARDLTSVIISANRNYAYTVDNFEDD
jgi:polysaccharide export outer membrane protein